MGPFLDPFWTIYNMYHIKNIASKIFCFRISEYDLNFSKLILNCFPHEFQEDHLWKALPYHELVQFLHAFQIVVKSFDELLHKELLKTFECFSNVLCHSKSISRHLASKCYASLASVKRNETITGQFSQIIFFVDI